MSASRPFRTLLCALAVLSVGSTAYAVAPGTVLVNPGGIVVPDQIPPGTAPGTLLAALSVPFAPTLNDYSATLVTAVFREDSGGLDFYYQITNNATASACGTAGKPACDAISRLTGSAFDSTLTTVGFRTDGASLPGGVFVNGTAAPSTADRNLSGNVIGFQFDPLKIPPGSSSMVVVVSVNSVNFASGNASVIDGGATTQPSFQPSAGATPMYRYDFYQKGTTTPAASLVFPGIVRDFSPASVPINNFNYFVAPSPNSLVPCNLTSNSSGELDCRLPGRVGGIFNFIFAFGGYPRQLGSFFGSGFVSPSAANPGTGSIQLQNGQITQIAP